MTSRLRSPTVGDMIKRRGSVVVFVNSAMEPTMIHQLKVIFQNVFLSSIVFRIVWLYETTSVI
jgi:hypothetical protein